jgi:hypothetical protein
LKLRGYVVVVASIAILMTLFSRWQDTQKGNAQNGIADSQQSEFVQAEIVRQRDAISATLLNGVPLRWEQSLTKPSERSIACYLVYGYDEAGEERLHLIFRADSGRIDSISLLRTEHSDEVLMSPEAGEKLAGAWLARVGQPSGRWQPVGREMVDPRPDRRMIFSRWRTASTEAFIGVERRTGLPGIIRFRYASDVQIAQRLKAETTEYLRDAQFRQQYK